MKMNLKMIAVAAALVASAGANAAYVSPASGSGSLVLTVWNTVTGSAYFRDLAFDSAVTLNTFLPNSVTTAAGDGGVTGNKTPNADLAIDKTTAGYGSFAGTTGTDTLWTTYLTGNNDTSQLRWAVTAADQTSVAGTNNVSRLMITSNTPGTFVNSAVTSNSTPFASNYFTAGNRSAVDTLGSSIVFANFGTGLASAPLLDQSATVYYFRRTQGTLVNSTPAARIQYVNDYGPATFLLASNGDLSYQITGVPEPETLLMFGAGLFGIAAAVARRRKAAAA